MSQDRGLPAYQGHLNQQCVTIAEVLREKGYRTIMSGKWHVGDQRAYWPDRRGFDRFFGVPSGGGLYFYPSEFINRPIYRNGELVTPDPETFYSTDNFTDEAIAFVQEADAEDKPFFLYLAYIAPHFPLQAWPEDIAKYEGKYDAGYEAIRTRRFQRQQKLGVVSETAKLSPPGFPNWSSLANPAAEARKMEIYAAQVDRLDQNVGRLLEALKDMKALEQHDHYVLVGQRGYVRRNQPQCSESRNRHQRLLRILRKALGQREQHPVPALQKYDPRRGYDHPPNCALAKGNS